MGTVGAVLIPPSACPCCRRGKETAQVNVPGGVITTHSARMMCDRCAGYVYRLMTCPHEVRRG